LSESPLLLSPYAAASRRSESSAPGGIPPASPEFDLEEEQEEPAPARPVREGLPATYRMRAEPHYVEALAHRRAEPPPAAVTAVPDATTNAPAERILGEASNSVARAVESIQRSLAELAGEPRSLRDRMLIALARAEAVRAAWLADAFAVLQCEPLPRLDQVNLGAVISKIGEALLPEQRITGQVLALARTDRPVTVFGDERLLMVAVGGMVQGLAACLGGAGLGRVALRTTPLRDGTTRGVEVSQTAVRIPAAVLGRLFDAGWAEHPGGTTAAVLLAAARRIATLQGGTLDARAIDTGGSRLLLTLPAAE
jgi:hypothetical protein